MNYLTLDLIKRHLQIDPDYTADDSYLELLGGACEEAVGMVIDDDMSGLTEEHDGTLPLPLQQACLLLIGTYYSNRESNAYGISVTEVPLGFTYLTNLYRNYYGGEDEAMMLKELTKKVEELTKYMEFDSKRVITGDTGVNVTTQNSGETTTIAVDEIDEGEY